MEQEVRFEYARRVGKKFDFHLYNFYSILFLGNKLYDNKYFYANDWMICTHDRIIYGEMRNLDDELCFDWRNTPSSFLPPIE